MAEVQLGDINTVDSGFFRSLLHRVTQQYSSTADTPGIRDFMGDVPQ